jgi:hypothetical protein
MVAENFAKFSCEMQRIPPNPISDVDSLSVLLKINAAGKTGKYLKYVAKSC